jgi:RES domain-containing protein
MRAMGIRRGGISSKLLRTIEPRPFAGIAYRFIGSRFLQSPLTSAGSQAHGGRFNPPGSFEVLYTALAADTALAEREGILLTDAAIKAAPGVRTGVLLRLDCHLSSVLDLTDEPLRQQLEISLADLLGPWLPWNVPALSESGTNQVHAAPSQLIGLSVYASRHIEAVLSPSAKDSAGRCLAIFPDRLQPGSRIGIEDPEGTITGALGLGRH